jgi:3-dehydroshikimate dehydratase
VIRTGLVSITFRQLDVAAVVDLAARAGLEGIEWGGDVHVPLGDMDAARYAAGLTAEAGLRVACYGSYYRLGERPADPAVPAAMVQTAGVLGAPLIRVWAGRLGSAEAGEEHWSIVVDDARALAKMAEAEGVGIAYEYHRNTLTDTRASAARLLELTALSNVGTLWQPEPTRDPAENLADLTGVLPRLRNVHVFSWTPQRDRLPLATQRPAWQTYLGTVAALAGERFALLEFVAGDDPAQLIEDAQTLRELVEETRS